MSIPDNMKQITECALALIKQDKNMKTSTFYKLFIWFIVTMFAIDFGFQFISESNTFLNIIGLFIIATHALVSVKTHCFTTIKFTKK